MFIPLAEAAEKMNGVEKIEEVLEADATVALSAMKNGLSKALGHMKRHAGIRFSWTSEYWQSRRIQHESGEKLIADWGTKGLSYPRFSYLRQLAGTV